MLDTPLLVFFFTASVILLAVALFSIGLNYLLDAKDGMHEMDYSAGHEFDYEDSKDE